MTGRAVATFNTGSSSLKFSLYEVGRQNTLGDCLVQGAVRDLGESQHADLATGAPADSLSRAIANRTGLTDLISGISTWLAEQYPGYHVAGVGHRIVHGGQRHRGPAVADDDVMTELEALSVFAPSHQSYNLAGVRATRDAWPEARLTLSFDTAFHRTMPRMAQLYALPRDLSDQGILRYGFHGLSFAHVAETIGGILGRQPKRLVAFHLGSGASACAMLEGKSIATTMGLTVLDGLPMATRCGDIDPGILLHLLQDRGMSAGQVADLLYNRSGLLGVSGGLSPDMRVLLESSRPEAEEAIALYCYRIARTAGSLATALGGLDCIVFTGGVGENAPEIRRRIVEHLAWLGPAIDDDANQENADILSTGTSKVQIVRIAANEESIIAQECVSLL